MRSTTQSNAQHELKLSPIQLCNADFIDMELRWLHLARSYKVPTKSALLQRSRKSSAENFPCGWLKRPSSLAVGVPEKGGWKLVRTHQL